MNISRRRECDGESGWSAIILERSSSAISISLTLEGCNLIACSISYNNILLSSIETVLYENYRT